MSGKYALIIGNTEYIDPGLAQLTAPGRDAEDFARVLREQEICAFDQVKVLLNQLSSTVIEGIDEFFDQKKPDDLLVLYFSGHGVRDEFGSLYLAFRNTIRSRLRSTAVKSDYIREAMDQSRSKRQVVVLDCCNSGAFPQGTKAEVGGAMGMTLAFQGYGRFVLTASDATQFAWEGDKVIGETQNSLFTHFLIKGLEGEADSDGDGKISVDELYDFAYGQILRVTPKQTPTKSASKQEGEIILREITRMEDIKPVPLPAPLVDSIENPLVEIRLVAVQQLIKLLNGKNLGLARSATEALERIAASDDSRQISTAALQGLEASHQGQGPDAQNIESEIIASQKPAKPSMAPAQKQQEPAENIAITRLTSERLEAEPTTHPGINVKPQEREKAKPEPRRNDPAPIGTGIHTAQKQADQKSTPLKTEDQPTDRIPKARIQQEVSRKMSLTETKPRRAAWVISTMAGVAVLMLILCGVGGFLYFRNMGVPPASEEPVPTTVTTADASQLNLPVSPEIEITSTVRATLTARPRSTATARPANTSTPRPTSTWTPRPARGTCKDGYVHRMITASDKVCVSPASKAQADSDNAAAESRKILTGYLNEFGENACASGYVWRNAYPGDVVCVDPAVRDQVAEDNAVAQSRWVDGAFGPNTCISGFVWRTANESDLVCVEPPDRDQAQIDNSQAESRKAVNVYGEYECISGYVWREAFEGDLVCVTPEVRQQVREDNRDAPNHTWQ